MDPLFPSSKLPANISFNKELENLTKNGRLISEDGTLKRASFFKALFEDLKAAFGFQSKTANLKENIANYIVDHADDIVDDKGKIKDEQTKQMIQKLAYKGGLVSQNSKKKSSLTINEIMQIALANATPAKADSLKDKPVYKILSPSDQKEQPFQLPPTQIFERYVDKSIKREKSKDQDTAEADASSKDENANQGDAATSSEENSKNPQQETTHILTPQEEKRSQPQKILTDQDSQHAIPEAKEKTDINIPEIKTEEGIEKAKKIKTKEIKETKIEIIDSEADKDAWNVKKIIVAMFVCLGGLAATYISRNSFVTEPPTTPATDVSTHQAITSPQTQQTTQTHSPFDQTLHFEGPLQGTQSPIYEPIPFAATWSTLPTTTKNFADRIAYNKKPSQETFDVPSSPKITLENYQGNSSAVPKETPGTTIIPPPDELKDTLPKTTPEDENHAICPAPSPLPQSNVSTKADNPNIAHHTTVDSQDKNDPPSTNIKIKETISFIPIETPITPTLDTLSKTTPENHVIPPSSQFPQDLGDNNPGKPEIVHKIPLNTAETTSRVGEAILGTTILLVGGVVIGAIANRGQTVPELPADPESKKNNEKKPDNGEPSNAKPTTHQKNLEENLSSGTPPQEPSNHPTVDLLNSPPDQDKKTGAPLQGKLDVPVPDATPTQNLPTALSLNSQTPRKELIKKPEKQTKRPSEALAVTLTKAQDALKKANEKLAEAKTNLTNATEKDKQAALGKVTSAEGAVTRAKTNLQKAEAALAAEAEAAQPKKISLAELSDLYQQGRGVEALNQWFMFSENTPLTEILQVLKFEEGTKDVIKNCLSVLISTKKEDAVATNELYSHLKTLLVEDASKQTAIELLTEFAKIHEKKEEIETFLKPYIQQKEIKNTKKTDFFIKSKNLETILREIKEKIEEDPNCVISLKFEKIDKNRINEIINNYGKNINEIKLHRIDSELDSDLLENILKNCENLSNLEIRDQYFSTNSDLTINVHHANLKKLVISDTRGSEKSIKGIEKLPNLNSVLLSYSSNCTFEGLESLKKLEEFKLYAYNSKNFNVGVFTNLKDITIRNCINLNLNGLELLENLEKIDVCFNSELTFNLPDYYDKKNEFYKIDLSNLKKLVGITFSTESGEGNINVSGFDKLINLKNICLRGSGISCEDISEVKNNYNLEVLELSSIKSSKKIIFNDLKKLLCLNVNNVNIENEIDLSKLENLIELNITNQDNITEIVGNNKYHQLEKLNIQGNTKLKNISNFGNLTNLKEFEFSRCESLTKIPQFTTYKIKSNGISCDPLSDVMAINLLNQFLKLEKSVLENFSYSNQNMISSAISLFSKINNEQKDQAIELIYNKGITIKQLEDIYKISKDNNSFSVNLSIVSAIYTEKSIKDYKDDILTQLISLEEEKCEMWEIIRDEALEKAKKAETKVYAIPALLALSFLDGKDDKFFTDYKNNYPMLQRQLRNGNNLRALSELLLKCRTENDHVLELNEKYEDLLTKKIEDLNPKQQANVLKLGNAKKGILNLKECISKSFDEPKKLEKNWKTLKGVVDMKLAPKLVILGSCNETFKAIDEKIKESFTQEFELGVIDNFEEKYAKTIGEFRMEGALTIYKNNLSKRERNYDIEIKPYINKFVSDLLNGDYPNSRYASSEHLEKIFQCIPDLKEKWKMSHETKVDNSKKIDDSKLTVIDTDKAKYLLFVGEDTPSCQAITGEDEANKCLLAYCLDGKNRMIAVLNEDDKIIGRTIIRLLWNSEEKKPVLFKEELYVNNDNEKIKKLIEDECIARAKSLGLPLYELDQDELGQEQTFQLQSLSGSKTGELKPYQNEYVDALKRSQGGGTRTSHGVFNLSHFKLVYNPASDSANTTTSL